MATGRLTLETARDVLAAVHEALAIPHPATQGDVVKHREILASRVMHATVTLKAILEENGDPAWHVRYLRDRLAATPAAGYRTWDELVAETRRRQQAREAETSDGQ